MRIILTGGGTGGHLMPLVAVARKIREKVPEVEFFFIGPKGDLENDIMGQENIPIKNILTGKLRRYFSFQNFIDLFRIPLGIIQSLWILLVLILPSLVGYFLKIESKPILTAKDNKIYLNNKIIDK